MLALLGAPTAAIRAQQNAAADTAVGIQTIPGAVLIEDRTRQLEAEKPANRIAVAAYHTDADLKIVLKYFKAQAQKSSLPSNSGTVLKALFRDNWKIEKRPFPANNNIFGVRRDVVLTIPQLGSQQAQSSFGAVYLGDSLVRVHLMSPYLSTDSSTVVPGTLIILVRERLPQSGGQGAGDAVAADDKAAYSPKEVTRKAHIRSRTEPEYTDEARAHGINGVVVIRAIFSSSGEVTNIRVIQGLPYGLTEKAVEAARKIRFEPAIKDGRQVSQYVQIEYYFSTGL
jgi:TonB family protein